MKRARLDTTLGLGVGTVIGFALGGLLAFQPVASWATFLMFGSALIAVGAINQSRMGWIVDKSSLPQSEQGDKPHHGEHRHV